MSADDPRKRQPNIWFDLNPTYLGSALVSFEGGKRIIKGKASCSFSDAEGGTIAFECEDVESSGALDSLFWRGEPGVISVNGPPGPDSLTISLDSGQFNADYKVFFRSHSSTLGGTPTNSKASFSAIGASYSAQSTEKAAHIVLPLYNMLSPAFESWPRPQPQSINNHPLRIYPTPPELNDAATPEDELNRNWHNRLISFLIDGEVGFVEPLPDYAERAEKLRNGTAARLVTAMLVFKAVGRECRANEPSSWFPLDVLNLLSLVTGSRVGAPWIEYRTECGRLLRRVHVAFGSPTFGPGHPIVIEQLAPNSGYLITEGMKSPVLSTRLLRLMINHLINAGLKPSSIEDRFLSVCRAFEAFATDRGLSVQDIKAGLDSATSQHVTTVLQECWRSLRTLADSLSDPGQKQDVNRIADKARSADQRDKSFGDSVADVAAHMGFEDGNVLLKGFKASDGNNWCAFLSSLRGAAVHEGGFDVFGGVHDIIEVARVTDHLHDLLIRIVCKLLGFQAAYSTTIFPFLLLRELDWVKASTPASDLIVVN